MLLGETKEFSQDKFHDTTKKLEKIREKITTAERKILFCVRLTERGIAWNPKLWREKNSLPPLKEDNSVGSKRDRSDSKTPKAEGERPR